MSNVQLTPLVFMSSEEQTLLVQEVSARFGLGKAEHFLVCACDAVLETELELIPDSYLS